LKQSSETFPLLLDGQSNIFGSPRNLLRQVAADNSCLKLRLQPLNDLSMLTGDLLMPANPFQQRSSSLNAFPGGMGSRSTTANNQPGFADLFS